MPKWLVQISQLRWESCDVLVEAPGMAEAEAVAKGACDSDALHERFDIEWDHGDTENDGELSPAFYVREPEEWELVSKPDLGAGEKKPLRRFEVCFDRPEPSGAAACWVRGLFVCEAEDPEHAVEQCMDAHPNSRPRSTRTLVGAHTEVLVLA